jgi:hypothetical protein
MTRMHTMSVGKFQRNGSLIRSGPISVTIMSRRDRHRKMWTRLRRREVRWRPFSKRKNRVIHPFHPSTSEFITKSRATALRCGSWIVGRHEVSRHSGRNPVKQRNRPRAKMLSTENANGSLIHQSTRRANVWVTHFMADSMAGPSRLRKTTK